MSFIFAVDFGTGRSGVGYCVAGAANQIEASRFLENWPGGQRGAKSCDTALLVDRGGKVLAWGREAFNQSERTPNSYYVSLVKLDLYGEPSRDGLYELRVDPNDPKGPKREYRDGASFYSVDLIASFLAQLKKELTKYVCRNASRAIAVEYPRLRGLTDEFFNESDYRDDRPSVQEFVWNQTWVLTVPANASDEHRRYMRMAAYKAGLIENYNSSKLRLALEPESAAVFVGALPERGFEDGEVFMVIDAGSGTVDVSAYRYIAGNQAAYDQLARSEATNAGSSYLDGALCAAVEGLFGGLFGRDRRLFEDFKEREPDAWRRICRGNSYGSIEQAKEGAGLNDDLLVDLSSLTRRLETTHRYYLKHRNLSGDVMNATLRYKPDETRRLFAPVFEEAWKPVQDVLNRLRQGNNLPTRVVVVGGLGASPYFEEFVVQKLQNARLNAEIVPIDGSDKRRAVLAGAIMQGVCNRVLTRVVRKTYGTICNLLYDAESKRRFGKLPKECLFNNPHQERNPWIRNAVSTFVRNNDSVRADQPIVKEFSVIEPDQTELRFRLIAADNPDPLFLSDADVRELSSVTLSLAGEGLGRGAVVEMRFGETEVVLTAYERGRERNRVERRGELISGAGAAPTMEALCDN